MKRLKKSKHNATATQCQEVFGADAPKNELVQNLKTGQKVVYKVSTNLTIADGDTTPAADVETTINVSVDVMKPEAISEEKPIKLAKQDDTVVYMYTAVDTDDYNIKWTKKDENAVDATFAISDSLTTLDTFVDISKGTSKALRAGETLYIKAKAKADNADGTLSIKPDKSNLKTLKSGVPSDKFTFEKDKGGKQSYRFIAPVDGVYSVVANLEENAGSVNDLNVTGEAYLPDNKKNPINVVPKNGYWYIRLS